MTQRDRFAPERSPVSHAGIGTRAHLRAEYAALFERVGARIRALCEARQMPYEDLGRVAKLNYWQTQGYGAAGPFERDFPLTALYRIAKALGVRVRELLK